MEGKELELLYGYKFFVMLSWVIHKLYKAYCLQPRMSKTKLFHIFKHLFIFFTILLQLIMILRNKNNIRRNIICMAAVNFNVYKYIYILRLTWFVRSFLLLSTSIWVPFLHNINSNIKQFYRWKSEYIMYCVLQHPTRVIFNFDDIIYYTLHCI